MTVKPVYICGTGIISPLGVDYAATEAKLRQGDTAIRPLDLFSLVQENPLPVGQAPLPEERADSTHFLPRSHRLALAAAKQAMTDKVTDKITDTKDGVSGVPSEIEIIPDAVILGTTTGGILFTEELLYQQVKEEQVKDKSRFRYHGLHTVANCIAAACHCIGPALTVSTACASGAVALALALRMLRSGQAETVLAGGVDSLCRLTYFGFHSLQLVDRKGCKPLDQNRQGMAVAEGAAMLLLSTAKPKHCRARLLGAGLSCDAYHPAAPHPEGKGAFAAMEAALADAGLTPDDIDYINLHGTGTPDNDLAESKAVRRLFSTVPPLSSIKGASGHSLAAAGAIEAVVSTLCVAQGLRPANTGLQQVDPALGLTPLIKPTVQPTKAVLSNSFGFGGNNASLVIGAPELPEKKHKDQEQPEEMLAVHSCSCLTGAGDLAATLEYLQNGGSAAGCAEQEIIAKNLPPRLIRRLKRLPRITLSLALEAVHAVQSKKGTESEKPAAIFMGTGWGALSDTYDFLTRLRESQEQFPSPTDFVGSVHNSPASQAAILFEATGPNITTSGGDYSFEQALLAAQLQLDDSMPALILGADEGHPEFSPLFDASIHQGASPADLADGGGALLVNRSMEGAICSVRLPFYQSSKGEDPVSALVKTLCPEGTKDLSRYALVLVGIPAAMEKEGEEQLARFMKQASLTAPVLRYRKQIGEFASASATAAALAVSFMAAGCIPGTLTGTEDILLDDQKNEQKNSILVLGLGEYITVMEFQRP
ncbi:MAG: beta-ketoacyl synthase N-terminal-like domain-containing protein [Candidatus Electrothrix sp. Rat3]|nr:beta-ketoacyl synthase N-terminal-like domain-containing protein [Candidatus Electrothrix rattekaaiensis]